MNRSIQKKIIMACALLASAPMQALVEPIDDISSIGEYLKPHSEHETLVILNIDSLILELLDLAALADETSSNTTCAFFTPAIIQGIKSNAQINLFSIDSVISELQEKGVIVFGLTTADPLEEDDILYQLTICPRTLTPATSFVHSINFSNNLNKKVQQDFSKKDIYSFREGIIFAGNNDAADVISAVLKHLHFCPKRVIYVDTDREWVKILEREFKCLGFNFIGLWVS